MLVAKWPSNSALAASKPVAIQEPASCCRSHTDSGHPADIQRQTRLICSGQSFVVHPSAAAAAAPELLPRTGGPPTDGLEGRRPQVGNT
jgi:hypothetical protein